MFDMFKKNETKDTLVADSRLCDNNRVMLKQQAAEHLQNLDEGHEIYSTAHTISCLHNVLNQLQSLYTSRELEQGLLIYGNYWYQKQDNGRYEIIIKTN